MLTTFERLSIATALLLLLVQPLLSTAVSTTRSAPGEHEYCENELMTMRCSYDEVIVFKSAMYGRMHLGRCIKLDMGHLGCTADVLDLADYKCSGRRSCQIRVPDPDFEATSPCLELKSFLKASYFCIKVFTAESTECRHSTPIRLPAIGGSEGHIASLATQETGWCGTDSSPWLIEAQPGQRINITMLDFGLQSGQIRIAKIAAVRSGVPRPIESGGLGGNPAPIPSYAGSATTASNCQIRYAVIREKSTVSTSLRLPRVFEVCGGQGSREKHVYLSHGHLVEIIVDARRDNPDYFVLRYEALYCADPVVPAGSFVHRESNDVITIRCRATGEQWRQTCINGEWSGDVIGNCSMTGEMIITSERLQDSTASTSAVVVTFCVLSSLITAVVALVSLFFVIRRKQQLVNNRRQVTRTSDPVSPKTLVTDVIAEDESYLRPFDANGAVTQHHMLQQLQHQPLLSTQRSHLNQHANEQFDFTVVDQFLPGCHGGGGCCSRTDTPSSPSTRIAGTLHKPRRNRNGAVDSGCGGCGVGDDSARTTPVTPRRVPNAGSSTLTAAAAAAGYHRATSCIEENRYTHIWEMPLPIPGE